MEIKAKQNETWTTITGQIEIFQQKGKEDLKDVIAVIRYQQKTMDSIMEESNCECTLTRVKVQTKVTLKRCEVLLDLPSRLFRLAVSLGMLTILNYNLSICVLTFCGYDVWNFMLTLFLTLALLSPLLFYITRMLVSKKQDMLKRYLADITLPIFAEIMSKHIAMKYKERPQPATKKYLCIICYENNASTRFLPCNHQVICGSCAWKYIGVSVEEKNGLRCVLCRTDIENFTGDLLTELTISYDELNEFYRKYFNNHHQR